MGDVERQQAIVDEMNAKEQAKRQRTASPILDDIVSDVREAAARSGGWGKWSQPGVPHKGWHCEDIDDVGGDGMEICEMCERVEVRYVHLMTHPDYPGGLRAGCICAGNMEQDVVGARGREREFKNRARRQRSAAEREARQAEKWRRWRIEEQRQREEERQWREAQQQRRAEQEAEAERREAASRKACEHNAKLADRILAMDRLWTREERRFVASYGRLMKAAVWSTEAQYERFAELVRQVPQREAEWWEKTKEARMKNWRWAPREDAVYWANRLG